MKSATSKPFLILGLCLGFAGILSLLRQSLINSVRIDVLQKVGPTGTSDATGCQNVAKELSRVVAQQKELSKLFNDALERKGQLECQVKNPKGGGGESDAGGWCTRTNLVAAHKHDEPLAKYLSGVWKGKNVASFGDGSGKYQELVKSHNEVKNYDSFDGNPFSRNATKGMVSFLDLSVPQYWLKPYDWIISMEVAEHIPAQFEEIYLDNIARYALEGIVLSWAKPRQAGRAHVNNRPPEHVRSQMLKRGFVADEKVSEEARAIATLKWLKNNVIIYRRNTTMVISESDNTT